jgi:hypothetical protein
MLNKEQGTQKSNENCSSRGYSEGTCTIMIIAVSLEKPGELEITRSCRLQLSYGKWDTSQYA